MKQNKPLEPPRILRAYAVDARPREVDIDWEIGILWIAFKHAVDKVVGWGDWLFPHDQTWRNFRRVVPLECKVQDVRMGKICKPVQR